MKFQAPSAFKRAGMPWVPIVFGVALVVGLAAAYLMR
jgi:hypothetical protein